MKAEPQNSDEPSSSEALDCDSMDESDRLFYPESNVKFILEGVKALNEGKGVVHDIIEVDE